MANPESDQRYPDSYWDGKAGYLEGSRILLHNSDYIEFLITRVWGLDEPCRVVDFGCGAGRFGQMLMPLLPEGSTYTGIDPSPVLLAEGRRVFAGTRYKAEFVEAGAHNAPFADNSFDVAVSQAMLMHIPDPMGAIREMIRVTRHGGLVITCDANRNAHSALFHIDEIDTQETQPLELFQTMNREIRRQTGVDHNIGVKTPILMHKAGLKNVQARISDSVRLILPPIDNDRKEALFRAVCDEGYGVAAPSAEERARWKASLVKYGIPAEDAEREIDRELAVAFREKGRDYHTVYACLLSFSFGTVDKVST